MLQIDPLNSSCSQEQQYPQKNIKAKSTPKEQLFGVSSCSESHTYRQVFSTALLKYLPYLMNN